MKRKITIASLIGAIAILCIACVGVFTNTQKEYEDIDPNNILVESTNTTGISLTSRTRKMAMSDGMQTTTTITATVGPEVAADKTLIWSIAWSSESSETLSDYVTMTVSEDTFSVTLTYIKQFSTQIKVTATSNLTTSVSAECLIDCYERTENVYINGNVAAGYFTVGGVSYSDIFVDNKAFTFNIDAKKSGTIDTTTNYTYTNLALSTELDNALKAAGFTIAGSNDNYANDGSVTYLSLIEGWIGQSYSSLSSSQRAALVQALNSVDVWYTLYGIATDCIPGTSTAVGTCNLTLYVRGFDLSDGLAITSVTLDKSQIIF